MGLLGRIQNMLTKRKRIDVKVLPSQGFFYEKEFSLQIKKADEEDIRQYESGYDKENLGAVLQRLKRIVEKNTILSGKYSFNHIRSIDIVYIFIEIVKFTKNTTVKVDYWDDESATTKQIEFCTENFNYFELDQELLDSWNSKKRCFDIDGYSYKLPSIGVENSITGYLIEKSYEEGAERFNDYSYNFTYFLGDKDNLRFEEIDNLIQIFNFDIEQEEKDYINRIVKRMVHIQRYSLRKNGRVIDLNAKLNLEKIWK